MSPEQRDILTELVKIMKVQGIASGGSGLSYYSEMGKLDFSPEHIKETMDALDKQFKAATRKIKANNEQLDKIIRRSTERTFESIINRVTRSLPTRGNILRRMDEVFDDLEDSVDEFDRALGASTKRLLREFNGNLNELSKVKRSFGSLVQDFNKYSTQLGANASRADISTMADNIADKMQELEANGLKELSETLKPTLDSIRKILAESKDRVITDAEMDTLRKTILENLPKMAETDEKLTNLFGRFIASQKEQSADFANTLKGAVALIGNDIRRLPGFITSEATNFQGDGITLSNWMTAFTQGMSPQDYNQMQLRYMVMQARGQEAFNASIEDINANLRNDYGLTAEAQTQMRNVMLDVAKNLGAVDNANFVDQVRHLTRVTEGVAKREGVSMQDAANMLLDISNEAYIQTRLIGKSDQEQINVLTEELDTRSRLNKQLGVSFEMQKQLNREQRSRMFQGFAEKMANSIRAGIATRMMGGSEEEVQIMQRAAFGGNMTDEERISYIKAQQQLYSKVEADKALGAETQSMTMGDVAGMVYSPLEDESIYNQINEQRRLAEQLSQTTLSGDNNAMIRATEVGGNDKDAASEGLGAVSVAVMRVQELIYAAGASPIASVLGGVTGAVLELAQTAALMGLAGRMGGGIGGGLLTKAGGAIASGATGLLQSRVGGSTGAAIAARGGMAAVGTVGAAALGGLGALYAGGSNLNTMFNPETEGKTRDEVTEAQTTATMKNIAILAGGAIGLIGGPVGVAIGAGAGALVGELGEAVSEYIPDWAKMLSPLGQISMGLERGINQWKELTDEEGNYAELARIEKGVRDGTIALNEDLINRYAELSDHGDGFWGGSTYTSAVEKEAAKKRLDAIFAAETGKIINANGELENAPDALIQLGLQLTGELSRLREVAEEHKDIDSKQVEVTQQAALDSKRQNEVRALRANLTDTLTSRFDVTGAFSGMNLS